jgi:hypothetical protein
MFTANISFPVMNESNSTPGTAGSSNSYNATFQASSRTKMNLTDKVPGLSSSATGVVVTLDGTTLTNGTNYTLGSLFLNDVSQGEHLISVRYSVPSGTTTQGGYTTPTPTATPTPAPTTSTGGTTTGTSIPPSTITAPSVTPAPTPEAGEERTPAPGGEVGAAPVTASDASNALNDARALLDEASGKGLTGLEEAENLLRLAQQAYDAGNYAVAKQYAEQAKALLQQKLSTIVLPKAAGGLFDSTWLIALLLVVIAGVAYWYSRKSR